MTLRSLNLIDRTRTTINSIKMVITYLSSGALAPKEKPITNLLYLLFIMRNLIEDLLSGEAVQDLTGDDDDEGGAEDHEMQLRKKLGIPEPDPDALLSTVINKYLSLDI